MFALLCGRPIVNLYSITFTSYYLFILISFKLLTYQVFYLFFRQTMVKLNCYLVNLLSAK